MALDEIAYSQKKTKEVPLLLTLLFVSLLSCGSCCLSDGVIGTVLLVVMVGIVAAVCGGGVVVAVAVVLLQILFLRLGFPLLVVLLAFLAVSIVVFVLLHDVLVGFGGKRHAMCEKLAIY